jgi:hypothetical protein
VPCGWRECHVGEHIGLSLVEETGKLGPFGPELVPAGLTGGPVTT